MGFCAAVLIKPFSPRKPSLKGLSCVSFVNNTVNAAALCKDNCIANTRLGYCSFLALMLMWFVY